MPSIISSAPTLLTIIRLGYLFSLTHPHILATDSPSKDVPIHIHHHSGQQPFILPSSKPSIQPDGRPLKKVAIIGAGPAGTSAAFFLSNFANQSQNPLELHIYERSDRLGGRVSTIHPFDSDDYPPIEAGASIFVPANKHLHRAIRQFNLTTVPFKSISDNPQNQEYAIWDGTEFAFQSSQSKWWDTIKLIWRYGWAPNQLKSITQRTSDRFETVYSNQFVSQGPFERLDRWVNTLGLDDPISKTGTQYLIDQEGINVQAVNELAAIMVRTNYGQDICHIHGLGTLISMVGSGGGSASVRGGNRQIFEGFANQSHAHIHLNHQITTITQLNTNPPNLPAKYQLSFHDHSIDHQTTTTTNTISNAGPFDTVILAAPYHQAAITILNSNETIRVPNQPFVRLHVTFIVTNATAPSGELFNRPKDELMATAIYSTMMRNVIGKGKRPIFNSLSYHQNLGTKPGVVGDMHIVKIFSEALLTTETLSKLFGSEQNLLWIKRIEWDAYPLLTPLKNFQEFSPTKLSQNLYYVNGFESVISTMETQTVAAFNIASLISLKLWDFIPKSSWI